MHEINKGGESLPIFRSDCPYHRDWCVNQEGRWPEIYSCERFTLEVGDNAKEFHVSCNFELEYEIQVWCLENTTGKWSAIPNLGSIVLFFFEDENDAIIFKLAFGETAKEIL